MKEQVITIKWPSGRYQLYLPNALNNISMTDLRKKVFEWLFKNLWVSPENERTVEVLDAYIPEWIQDLKGEWHDASVKFQQEYRDPKRGTTKEKRDAIKRENDSLFRKVKQTKKSYERSEKILTIWTETRARYMS